MKICAQQYLAIHDLRFSGHAAPRLFRAVVFKCAPSTPDFTCSERIVLPGEHTVDGARAALASALREDAAGLLIGGEIVPVLYARRLRSMLRSHAEGVGHTGK